MAENENKPVENGTASAPAAYALTKVEMKFKAPRKTAILAAEKAGEPVPTQRASFDVLIPQYTWEGLSSKFDDVKIRDFILSLVNETVASEARAQVTADDSPVNSDAELDKSKLILEYIATLSTSDRAGSTAVTKEELAAFADVFAEYLPAVAGLKTDQAKLVAQICKTRFSAIKQRVDFLTKIRGMLNQFADGAPTDKVEQFANVLEYLDSLADKYINRPESDKYADMFAGL